MTQLIKDILTDPFKYLGGAIMVILAVAMLVRWGKDIWNGIVNDD